MAREVLGLLLVVALAPRSVAAQAVDPVPGRFDVGGGVRWVGRSALGARNATLSTATGGQFALFESSSELAAAPGVEGHVGVRLTRGLQAEAGISYATAELRTRLSADSEGIPDTTVSETIARYTIEGGLLAYLSRWRLGAAVPFLIAGAGFLRELHEGRTLAETGAVYYAGAGVAVPLIAGPARGLGIRAEARLVVRSGGVAFDDPTTTVPALAASLFLRF